MAEHVKRVSGLALSLHNRTWKAPLRNSNRSYTKPIYIEEPLQDEYMGFLSFCLILISVLGVAINVVMIYLTKTSKKRLNGQELNGGHLQVQRKELMHFFILNLAVSDATGSLAGAVSLVVEANLKFTVQSNFNCKLARFIQLLFPTTTAHILLIIIIERWRTIASPLFVLKKATAQKIIYGCWLWSAAVIICIGLPSYKIQISNLDKQHFTQVCMYSNGKDEDMAPKVLFIIFCILAFVAPCVSLISISIYIASRIVKDARPDLCVSATPMAIIVNQREKYKVTRIFMIITAAFVTPYLIYILYGIFSSTGLVPKENYRKDMALRCTWATLVYFNTIVNPVVISVQCKSIRQRFCALFTRSKQNKVSSVQNGDAQVNYERTDLQASGLEMELQELNLQKPSASQR